MADSALRSALSWGVDTGIDMLGFSLYSMISPTMAGHPAYRGAGEHNRYIASDYLPYQIQSRDAELNYRVEAFIDVAEKHNIPRYILEANRGLLVMLLKNDTPELREQLRQRIPLFGDAVVGLLKSITSDEEGIDRVYAGFGNTMGSSVVNEMAAYGTRVVSNRVRQYETNENGLRYTNASAIGAYLQLQQNTGYNFGVAAGLTGENAVHYDQLFTDELNKDQAVKNEATKAYLSNLIGVTTDETDKQILTRMKNNLESGRNLEEGLEKFTGFGKEYANVEELTSKFNIAGNASKYAQINTAAVQSHYILNNIGEGGQLRDLYEQYAKEQNVDLANVDEQTRSRLERSFSHQIQKDLLTTDVEQRHFKNINDNFLQKYTAIDDIIRAQNPQMQRVDAEIGNVERRTHDFQIAGQMFFGQLSAAEQQQYIQTYGSPEAAQVHLAFEMTDKYAHDSVRRLDYGGAVREVQQLAAAQALAGLSKDQLSQQAAFIGSISKNKGLTSIATRATVAWEAAAKAQGVQLSPEQRLEGAQRITRLTESIQGNSIALLMSQDLDPNSELGQLQQALRTGNLTSEQEDKLRYYLNTRGALIKDISDATGLDEGTLIGDARWARTNWSEMTEEEQLNVVNAMHKQMQRTRHSTLATENRLENLFSERRLTKAGLESMYEEGIQGKNFTSMLHSVIQKGGINVAKLISGAISDAELENLQDQGLTEAARYGALRRAKFEQKKAELLKTNGGNEEKATRDALHAMGYYKASRAMSTIYGNEDAAEFQATIDTIDTSKKVHQTKGVSKSTVEQITEIRDESDLYGGARSASKDKDTVDILAESKGLDPATIRKGMEPYTGTVKSIKDWLLNWMFGGEEGTKDTSKAKESSADNKLANDDGIKRDIANAIIAAMGTPEFKTGFGKQIRKAMNGGDEPTNEEAVA